MFFQRKIDRHICKPLHIKITYEDRKLFELKDFVIIFADFIVLQ